MFVELEQGLEGLLHISELSDNKIESPEEVVKVGDDVDVKVLPRRREGTQDRPGVMRNVDDPTVPENVPDLPIEGPEAEEGDGNPPRPLAKARREKTEGKKKEKEKEEETTLRWRYRRGRPAVPDARKEVD